jgi:hypothetical protein
MKKAGPDMKTTFASALLFQATLLEFLAIKGRLKIR